jgi:hypothetical protein
MDLGGQAAARATRATGSLFLTIGGMLMNTDLGRAIICISAS